MAFTSTSGGIIGPYRTTHRIQHNVIPLPRRHSKAAFSNMKQFVKINDSVDNNNHHHRRRHQPDPPSPPLLQKASFLPNPTTTRRQALLSALSLITTLSSPPPSPAVAAATIATAAAAVSALSILKPPLDKRRYEFLTLENGLRVLLCSDPSSSTAAAAMDVHVGATSDPVDVKGLAHFCEHMLFLGTQRYPQEDSFSSFLSANGGTSNAFTDSENTVYFFDMDGTSNLKEGLDRFGSFFSGPLFTEGATERELNAIESENAKNLQSDTFRLYQIEKSRANSHHPFSKFFTGNKFTLLEETKRKGINLRNELVNFYTKYYSANQMTLAIVAPQSIDTLKEWISGKACPSFGEIPNRMVAKPEDAWRGVKAFTDNVGDSIIPSLGTIVEMVPVSDIRRVMISWPILFPSPDEERRMKLVKPDYYVAHLLGHEGINSLLSYLKSKGWANAVSCSSGNELSDFNTIELAVDLTTAGLKRVERVIEAIFSYIKMLGEKQMADYHLDEVLNLSELEWRYMTKSEASGYVTSLATAMQTYDPSLVIAGPRRLALLVDDNDGGRLLESSDPRVTFDTNDQRSLSRDATLHLLSQLTVANAIITILSKSFEGRTNEKEYWYQTDYRYRDISPSLKAKWSRPREGIQAMNYPPRNEFIPSEEGLKVKLPPAKTPKDDEALSFEERMTPVSPPMMVRDDERWTAYFKQDDRFGEPKAFVIFELLAKGVYETPLDVVLSMLYEYSSADRLDEYTYSASLAGLSYNLVVVPRGIRLTFGGYNDKLRDYASYVTNKLVKDLPSTLPQNESEFDRYKDTISRSLRAFDVKQPYAQAIYYSSLSQNPPRAQFLNSQLREAIAKATLDDLKSYVTKLFSIGKGVALIQGNLFKDEALALLSTIDATIGFTPTSDIPPVIKPLPFPKTNPTRLTFVTPNPQNKNSVSQITFQSLDTSSKSHVLIQLLASILEEPFYDDLRTKKQLGYIVSSGVKQFEQTRSLSLVVQSSIAPVETLTGEMLSFVDGFRERYLTPLKKGDFATYVKGLIDRKTEKDKTLATEVTRNWGEVINGYFLYDRVQREAKELLDVTKDDLLAFWDDLIANETRRMFVSEVIPVTGDATSPETPKMNYAVTNSGSSSFEVDTGSGMVRIGIDDIETFRNERASSIAIGDD